MAPDDNTRDPIDQPEASAHHATKPGRPLRLPNVPSVTIGKAVQGRDLIPARVGAQARAAIGRATAGSAASIAVQSAATRITQKALTTPAMQATLTSVAATAQQSGASAASVRRLVLPQIEVGERIRRSEAALHGSTRRALDEISERRREAEARDMEMLDLARRSARDAAASRGLSQESRDIAAASLSETRRGNGISWKVFVLGLIVTSVLTAVTVLFAS